MRFIGGCYVCSRVEYSRAMTRATLESVSPFFIAGDVERSVAFYRDQLGFTLAFQETEPPHQTPFFAIISRDRAMVFLKGSGAALPNPQRYAWARWDAYFYVPDPDALAAEFENRGVSFSEPLKDTHDGLRGFELKDPDGYVLFFGRPAASISAPGEFLADGG
jgi:catechol 2,3-dioxygenase-like lactoylglutathione lyase family enzyme